jgi:hypothetical protein
MNKTEPSPFWGWVVRGLGGILNLLEGILEEAGPPADSWRQALQEQADRLNDFLRKLDE